VHSIALKGTESAYTPYESGSLELISDGAAIGASTSLGINILTQMPLRRYGRGRHAGAAITSGCIPEL
jgi:hypothetical protein